MIPFYMEKRKKILYFQILISIIGANPCNKFANKEIYDFLPPVLKQLQKSNMVLVRSLLTPY